MKGLLSFRDVELPLDSLNLLIGPNATGKSNLLEACSILRAVPEDLPSAIRRGGGIAEWLWKGANPADACTLEATTCAEGNDPGYRYRLTLGAQGPYVLVLEESLKTERPDPGHEQPFLYFEVREGRGAISAKSKGTKRALHPDILPLIAELLREASRRTQVIATTHSDILIDALSDQPESVIVCSRDHEGATEFKRLSQESLRAWLEDYRLGELWRKGQLGGTRW